MKKDFKYISAIFILIIIFITGCATTKVPKPEQKAIDTTKLPPEKQKELSLKPFKEILALREKSPQDPETIKKVEKLYKQIQTQYPASPLAEESYLHLVKLYLRDYKPPAIDKAEKTYVEYIKNYPDSPFEKRIKDFILKFYYAAKLWKQLINFVTPDINNFIKTGRIADIEYLYMYAEAQYNLGDTIEAVKGYEWVIKLAPTTNTAYRARAKLKKIRAEGKLRP